MVTFNFVEEKLAPNNADYLSTPTRSICQSTETKDA